MAGQLATKCSWTDWSIILGQSCTCCQDSFEIFNAAIDKQNWLRPVVWKVVNWLEPRLENWHGLLGGSRAVYRIGLNSRGSQINRWRLIDGVSVYLHYQSICHITLLCSSSRRFISLISKARYGEHGFVNKCLKISP